MASTPAPETGPITSKPEPESTKKLTYLLIALAAYAIVLALPQPAGLTSSGQVALGLLVLVVILWISECVSPANSAVILTGAAVLGLMGTTITEGGKVLTSSTALGTMLTGFSSTAVLLVAAALFLAVALKHTGLDKRIALLVMSRIGVSPARLILGAMIVGFVLALFIPSATARVGAVIPIMIGITAALGLAANSSLGTALMIVTACACSIFNIGIKTGAAQNIISLNFMQQAFGQTITWSQWFITALPFTIGMCVVLFFTALWLLKPKVPSGEDMASQLRHQLAELGPVTAAEKRLIAVAALLLVMWSSEGVLHTFDTTTTTQIGIAILLMPKIGVMHWSQAEKLVPWGTIVLFAASISLGNLLSNTGAAAWLADQTLGKMGLAALPVIMVIASLSLFSIILHLGFASATGLASTLIPIMIAFTQTLPVSPETAFGIVMIQSFVVSFGFILPTNAPQNMLCYGTNAFTVDQFAKVGIIVTLAGLGLILLLSATLWPAMGVL
ncbi:SLC13 family permease [Comamonas kerstersii]|uniref:DASS family sodium-coupled anion symporter n=1 Tax=Comamonas kerstersii TaxID=225992 RepID=A0A6A1QYX3_9BURK|nr:DASS family sodium-coupled anion symporter [Comamonas kerstersii]KAB0583905.1 DASS family sodium-coupled anion symporter [Comamonas kerstersii]MDO4968188.1 DASS family sodium-coupled anion symporter [Comamonadaceae bacterium]